MEYETIIGLEVHTQLLTKSKIFCSCSTAFGAEPNTHTCPVCLGMPGVLPVLNKKAAEFTLKTALAIHCQINPLSQFARKNYFYPDLPKGYQISQYELPLAKDGYLEVEIKEERRRIGITRINLEEDAGKLMHELEGNSGPFSYVDFNRTGGPLMEIVSKPDIRTPEEASAYLKGLRSILQYLGVCDGNMEEGSLRCDANISLRKKGEEKLGVKVELKNMNSFKNVEKALEYEVQRQKAILEEGGKIIQETRLWDPNQEITLSMRGKEEAHDYRYFPEPDLLPLIISSQWIEEIKESLPELPQERKERFIKEYQIPSYDAELLTSSKSLANYYEECVKLFPQPKIVSNWIMGELLRELKQDNREIEDSPLTPLHLAEMLKLMEEGVISGKIAKQVFNEMYQSGKRAKEIVEEKGLVQLTDQRELIQIIEKVLLRNAKEVEEYRKGKEKLFGFFMGEVMKETKGKANPRLLNQLLQKELEKKGRG